MWKALVFKELRECAPSAAAALAAYGCLLAHALGMDMVFWPAPVQPDVPFVTDSFVTQTTLVSLCLAIGLAMKQVLAESTRATWLWLLHRPADRGLILATKLATGGGMYLLCAAFPIVVYAGWAAWPRTHASPFFWSMTRSAWEAWGIIGLFYLGGFLAALRPGRWMGTRLLPLAGVAALAAILYALFEPSASPLFVTVMWSLFVLVGAMVAAAILYVGRVRDFS